LFIETFLTTIFEKAQDLDHTFYNLSKMPENFIDDKSQKKIQCKFLFSIIFK